MIDIKNILKDDFVHYYKDGEVWSFILMIEKCGKATVRIYWYKDNLVDGYIDTLDVQPEFQHQGLGNKLLSICEGIAKALDMKTIALYADKDTWVQSWYERKGYRFLKDKDDEKGTVWLEKVL